MSNRELDFWPRELSRAGLSTAAQRKLLASLSNTVECRARYFPSPPRPYLARVEQFLMSAFFPQQGSLLLAVDPSSTPERLTRCQAWQIVHLELPLLDGSSRPVNELHIVLSDVISMMARNEFPLTVPPRYLIELFGVLERVVALKMEAHRWSIRPTVPLGVACQAFVEAK